MSIDLEIAPVGGFSLGYWPKEESMKTWMAVLATVGLISGCDSGHDHSSHKHESAAPAAAPEPSDPNVKPYPLKTCVVSGEELGKMGKPARIVYEGQEILFCCGGCEKDFRKEPAKFMKKIADAGKK